MKKLVDYKDEDALDLLADLAEPVAELMADKEFSAMVEVNRAAAIRIAIKGHKPTVMQILARMDSVPVEQYHCDFFTAPARLAELITNPTMLSVFSSSEATSAASESSTSR